MRNKIIYMAAIAAFFPLMNAYANVPAATIAANQVVSGSRPLPSEEEGDKKEKNKIKQVINYGASEDQAIIPIDNEVFAFKLPGTGWVIVTQDITPIQSVIEFVPSGHTAKDWRELISFQTFRVPSDVTIDEFAKQIADHWQKNCKGAESTVLQRKPVAGFNALLGLTDCPQASYSLLPEYMMYLVVRDQNRLHVIQRSVRGNDMKVDDDAWLKFFESVNICPKSDDKSKECLPKK